MGLTIRKAAYYLFLVVATTTYQNRVNAQSRVNQANRYNVLFIAIDDLNDWVGAFGGNPQAKTPNIDRLASRGVIFKKAYCASPLCNPSRAALMTGLRPGTTGVYENQHNAENMISQKVPRLQQQFAEKGYYVAGAGKIYHEGRRNKKGWTTYKEDFKGKTPGRNDPGVYSFPLNFGPVDTDDDEMEDMKIATWAADQLQVKREQPFFLAVGFKKPHLPWYAPKKYFDRFPLEQVKIAEVKKDDLSDIPPIGRVLANPGIGFTAPDSGDYYQLVKLGLDQKATQAYLATVNFVDACVGKVVNALEKSGQLDKTIIVLWGDHGWHLGEKLHWRKHTLWEEAIRNPLVISVPGLAEGVTCNRTVNLLDLYPTLVELCRLEPNKRLEGKSIVPLLKKPQSKWDRPSVTTYGYKNHSVRSERWHYIRYSDGTEELYDHNTDSMEWNNLAANSKYKNTKNELARWLPKTNHPETLKTSRFLEIPKYLNAK